jgi:hypothetical protein
MCLVGYYFCQANCELYDFHAFVVFVCLWHSLLLSHNHHFPAFILFFHAVTYEMMKWRFTGNFCIKWAGFNCNMLELRANWDKYWETTVWSAEFWGGSHMVKRVARCRITFINHENIISFLLIFSFCLTYINYIMACQNKCNSTVMYPMLRTHADPLGIVLPLCWHLYYVQSCAAYWRFGQQWTAYMTVVP